MNNYQSIGSGQAELKDYYNIDSQYEAIRRRRKKMVDKVGIEENDQENRDKIPDPKRR